LLPPLKNEPALLTLPEFPALLFDWLLPKNELLLELPIWLFVLLLFVFGKLFTLTGLGLLFLIIPCELLFEGAAAGLRFTCAGALVVFDWLTELLNCAWQIKGC
jgi:hypothetical protein